MFLILDKAYHATDESTLIYTFYRSRAVALENLDEINVVSAGYGIFLYYLYDTRAFEVEIRRGRRRSILVSRQEEPCTERRRCACTCR